MSQDLGKAAMKSVYEDAAQMILPETLGDFIASRASELGDNILCHFFMDEETLTYRELDLAANRMASSLLQLGVRKGTHVAMMMPNIKEGVVAWVAIGRIGGVVVPVNTAYTSSEMYFVLLDSDAQFAIIDSEYLDHFENLSDWPPLLIRERVIVRGEASAAYPNWRELDEAGSETFEAPTAVTATDLLNLQYTSGTTGFPKGCMLTHEYWMLISHLAALQRGERFGIKTTLIWAPFFYMDPQWQLLMAACLGGTTYVARRMKLSDFMSWLIDFKIEYCIFPEPALKRYPPSELDKKLSLKFVNAFGWRGEANVEIEKRLDIIARNSFGMTEIGGGITLPPDATDMIGTGTCGLPAPFREVRIVGEDEKDVALGEIGELWITGRAIMAGYYKRPEANAENFRGKWFRSGDLFRQDERGYYYIVGRIKEMIKRAGENISAFEVETVLRKMEPIEESAAVAVEDPVRKEELKVYILLKEGLSSDDCTPNMIFTHCEKHLAAFKIPRYIAYVTEFPRTPTRKIAKSKLLGGDLRIGAYDRSEDLWR